MKAMAWAWVALSLGVWACGGAVEPSPEPAGETAQGIVEGPGDACVEVTPALLAFAMCGDCADPMAEWSVVRTTCAEGGSWRQRCADVRPRCPVQP